ncbi:unnamed protein product [Bursaphelenchus xylophilus]|uniref:(pine wood nematode) hypothetical protein n=1 Tax=Bursaphelenchus xylophilus TaxID=6326 RepID=A0A7I8X8H6_BURXY|nr:unnamed protein product [Bursaphelenchus xylophilus]CAG9119039.1 unnamed protein product [Bursaphelenchus xylophilus]
MSRPRNSAIFAIREFAKRGERARPPNSAAVRSVEAVFCLTGIESANFFRTAQLTSLCGRIRDKNQPQPKNFLRFSPFEEEGALFSCASQIDSSEHSGRESGGISTPDFPTAFWNGDLVLSVRRQRLSPQHRIKWNFFGDNRRRVDCPAFKTQLKTA